MESSPHLRRNAMIRTPEMTTDVTRTAGLRRTSCVPQSVRVHASYSTRLRPWNTITCTKWRRKTGADSRFRFSPSILCFSTWTGKNTCIWTFRHPQSTLCLALFHILTKHRLRRFSCSLTTKSLWKEWQCKLSFQQQTFPYPHQWPKKRLKLWKRVP